ncbi:MAG: ATP-binding protein [Phycisphaerae bacterium]
MRLGIRRKVLGTLMLVGMIPLALCVGVILIGGSWLRVRSIQTRFNETAQLRANQLRLALRYELEYTLLLSRLPELPDAFTATNTQLNQIQTKAEILERDWASMPITDPYQKVILHGPLAKTFEIFQPQIWRENNTEADVHEHEILITDVTGHLIAANHKTNNYDQSGEFWWQSAYANGKGMIYVSSVVDSPSRHKPIIEIALPIMSGTQRSILGIIKIKIDMAWLWKIAYQRSTSATDADVFLIDRDVRKVVYAPLTSDVSVYDAVIPKVLDDSLPPGELDLLRSERMNGYFPLEFGGNLPNAGLVTRWPNLIQVVSQPTSRALENVYQLATAVAGIGVLSIVFLFGLGVWLANREIIAPILRLREATAAVGRGELCVRLLPNDKLDKAFRADEIGDLARDFDQMTRRMQQGMLQLERSNEAKRRFMELAGHELRTPVTFIIGVCELLQRQLREHTQTTPEAQTQNAQSAFMKIVVKAQRLNRIIENLLKLVDNDRFTTRLNLETIDVTAFLQTVVNEQRPFALERHVRVDVQLATHLPALQGDREKLEDVFGNLIGNAIRFTPDGQAVGVQARELTSDIIEIVIQDSGQGLSDQQIKELFEPFATGADIMHHTSNNTAEYGTRGLGLGLAIVRRFVELHHGHVYAHKNAQGGQFVVQLPVNHSGFMV